VPASGNDALRVVLEAARALTGCRASVLALVFGVGNRPPLAITAADRDEAEALGEAAVAHLGLRVPIPAGPPQPPASRRIKALGAKLYFEDIQAGGKLLGTLGISRPRNAAAARASLPWLASLAAVAIEDQQHLENAWRETKKLGTTYEASARANSKDILADTLEGLVRLAAGLASSRGAALYVLAEDGSAFLRQAWSAREKDLFPNRLLPQDVSIESADSDAGRVLTLGKAPSRGRAASAWLVPLEWGDRRLGVFVLALRRSLKTATVRDWQVARLLAAQAANALGVSAFVEAERRERRMAEALQEASQVIDRGLDLDEVLDHILEQVMRAFPCDAANFMSYEGDISRVLRSRGYEKFGLASMSAFTLEAPKYVNLRRLISGEAVTVADTATDPDWVYRPGVEWLRSWAGVPVRFGDEILGFVMLDSATPGAFDVTSSQRLMAFAAHAAAAMHNARLYRRLLQEHEKLQQVHAIGRNLAGSLSTDDILESLLSRSLRALGGVFGMAYLQGSPSRPGMKLRLRYPSDSRHGHLGSRLEIDPLVRTAATSRRPATTTVPIGPVTFTCLAFPIAAGDLVSGAAVLWVEGTLTGVETWLDVFAAVGQQAGLALSNAVEHAKVQRRLAEMTLLQRVVGNIARRLKSEAILAGLTEQLQASLGFPVVQFYMRDGDEYVLNQFRGPRPVLDRTPIHSGIVGRVLRTGVPSFVPDIRRDPDYLPGLVGTRAEIAVPIAIDGVTIGVLNVETSDPDQLDDDAFELLTLLGDQVSIALQNASLFEAAQLNVENLEARVRERTAQLEAVLEQAVAAERVKAQFVADVSHELRTPLTNIGLYLELLELSEDARRTEYMATLRRETERLGRLIEQLLAMSHLDTGQVQLRPQPTNLNSLLQVLIGDRSRMIARRGLHLELHPEPDLPDVQVDPQYIMQVLTNLLSNATNYTPQGGRISLETATQELEGEPWVTFTVRDTGPGIPEDEVEHIFDRFYRGSHARTSGVSGTGLGLPISKEIVERHGGRISLETQQGQGATFTVWLPLITARMPQVSIL
jgi:signal transduction histidine kinase